MDIIQQLKEEHVEILRLFDDITEDTDDDKTENRIILGYFRELNDILATHVDLENKTIYAKLKKSEHKELKELGKAFYNEMTSILGNVTRFFDKIKKEDIGRLRKSAAFRKDLNEITKKVRKRVAIEENILFPAYKRYYG